MIRTDTFPYCLWEYQRESTVMGSVCVTSVSLILLLHAEKMSWCTESIWNRMQNHLVLNVNTNYVQNG